MATTINAYSVSLAMDASSYINSSKLSRRETQQLARVINTSRQPADKLERAINALDVAYKKGAITLPVYNRLVDEQRRKFGQNATKANLMATATGKLNTTFVSLGKTFAGTAAAMFSVQGIIAAFRSLADQMQRIDTVAKSARGLGITFNQLRGVQMAAAEIAGADASQVTSLLGRLQRRIGDAATTSKQLAKVFEEDLKLSLEELQQMDVVDQFQTVKDAIAAIENPTIQTSVALKIFDAEGKKLLPLLQDSAVSMREYVEEFTNLAGISEQSVKHIEGINDQLAESQIAWEGLKNMVLGSSDAMMAVSLTIQRVTNDIGRLRAIAKMGLTALFGPGPHEELERIEKRLEAARANPNVFGGFGPNDIKRMEARAEELRERLGISPLSDEERRGVIANLDRIRNKQQEEQIDHLANLRKAVENQERWRSVNQIGNPFQDRMLGFGDLAPGTATQSPVKVLDNVAKAIDADSNEAHQFMLEAQKRAAEEKAKEEQRAKQAAKQREMTINAINKLRETFGLQGWGAV